ncbi:MAG: GntR family transcriptional regulator [Peptostreptococcaceae bacterium]|nr:GntR family transcriptional regulator [Peptostreptococcaceae bacterium]
MNIIIANSSKDPIYLQISTQLKEEILKGELTQGDALPSIRSLAKDLRISVITTKRAYEELERDGFIDTVPGKGSFVAGQNQELLFEQRLREIEGKLSVLLDEARIIGLSSKDLSEMMSIIEED